MPAWPCCFSLEGVTMAVGLRGVVLLLAAVTASRGFQSASSSPVACLTANRLSPPSLLLSPFSLAMSRDRLAGMKVSHPFRARDGSSR